MRVCTVGVIESSAISSIEISFLPDVALFSIILFTSCRPLILLDNERIGFSSLIAFSKNISTHFDRTNVAPVKRIFVLLLVYISRLECYTYPR